MNILFLDDMETRHTAFMNAVNNSTVCISQVRTADAAISALEKMTFDQVFLDHDLSIEDIMVEVGGPSKEKTGMAVAEFISKMENPPPYVIVHSCNTPAAEAMINCLRGCTKPIKLLKLPFPYLLQSL